MKIKSNCLQALLIILLGGWSSFSIAEKEVISLDCAEANTNSEDAKFFKELEEIAKEHNTNMCWSAVAGERETADEIREELKEFQTRSKEILLKHFTTDELQSGLKSQFAYYENRIAAYDLEWLKSTYPRLSTNLFPDAEFRFTDNPTKIVVSNNDAESCKTLFRKEDGSEGFSSCLAALKDAEYAFNNYSSVITQVKTKENEILFTDLQASWRSFQREARGQTILDVWATTFLHDDYYSQNKLVSPHSWQWFFLHPDVVYEYRKQAENGDRSETSLAVEWVGFNVWDAKIPWGLGVVSVWSDFSDTDALGTGLQLTLNNKYSVGFIPRSGDDGIFLNLNLTSLVQDKAQMVKNYGLLAD